MDEGSEDLPYQTTGIETHPEYLHLTLLETNPTQILNVADGVERRLESLRSSRNQDRRFQWLDPDAPRPDHKGPAHYYQPRTYLTSGTFDLAALFFSPSLEMTAWLQDPQTLRAGHDSNICLLPNAESVFRDGLSERLQGNPCFPTDRLPDDLTDIPDFNRELVDSFADHFAESPEPKPPTGKLLKAPHRFVSITKMKLNPLVIWAPPKDPVETEVGRLREVVQSLWLTIHLWRQELADQEHGPSACLGLAFGWNEVLLVANSSSPHHLMDLALRVRQIHTKTTEPMNQSLNGKGVTDKLSHLALTTLTTLGHDIALRRYAKGILVEKSDELRQKAGSESADENGRNRESDESGQAGEPETPPLGQISPAYLIRAAQTLEKNLDGDTTASAEGEPGLLRPSTMFIQIGCYAYPGHERSVLELLFQLECELRDQGILHRDGPHGLACLDVGKRDIWTPYIPLAAKSLGPTGISTLISLIQLWLRYSGYPLDPEQEDGASECESQKDQSEPIHDNVTLPAAFDFYTRIGWTPQLADSSNEKPSPSDGELLRRYSHMLEKSSLREIPAGHVKGLPRRILTPERVERQIQKVMRAQGAKPPADTFLEPLRSAMRNLQLPYALSEQIFNVINIFYWAYNREVIWDESAELISPILAFSSFIERYSQEWEEAVSEFQDMEHHILEAKFHDGERYKALLAKEKEALRHRMAALPEGEVFLFLNAMRAYFYTTQFSNYLMGEMPDLNLRFKGSLHQLLRLSNMIFDALVDIVMGPRACLAIINDTLSPKVTMTCDIPVVELSSSTFTNPLMLESLAHEVSHLFLLDLASWYRVNRSNAWSSPSTGLGPGEHLWASPRLLSEAKQNSLRLVRGTYKTLNQNVFLHSLSSLEKGKPDVEPFIEATADFMEAELLGYGIWDLLAEPLDDGKTRREKLKDLEDAEHASFRLWLRSFLLRVLLSTGSLDPPGPAAEKDAKGASEAKKGRPADTPVPGVDAQMLRSAVIRAALVKCFRIVILRLSHESGNEFSVRNLKSYLHDPLLTLRKTLREECILGLATPVLEELLNAKEELWTDFMEKNVLGLRMFTDRYAVSAMMNFHGALIVHIGTKIKNDENQDDESSPYQGAGRLWGTIRNAFAELWEGYTPNEIKKKDPDEVIEIEKDPDEVIEKDPDEVTEETQEEISEGATHHQGLGILMKSAVFIQHWLSDADRQTLRNTGKLNGAGTAQKPWRAHRQPLKWHWAPEDAPTPHLNIFQRGRIQPISQQDQNIWDRSIQRFLVRLLSMVPAWHRSVLDEIDRVLQEEEKLKQSETPDETAP